MDGANIGVEDEATSVLCVCVCVLCMCMCVVHVCVHACVYMCACGCGRSEVMGLPFLPLSYQGGLHQVHVLVEPLPECEVPSLQLVLWCTHTIGHKLKKSG